MSPGAIAPVIASLPISLVSARNRRGVGDLVAVHGGLGWPERTADVFCSTPQGPDDRPSERRSPRIEVPRSHRVPVVIDYRFAGNPLPSAAAAMAFDGWPADAMIEVAALVSGPE